MAAALPAVAGVVTDTTARVVEGTKKLLNEGDPILTVSGWLLRAGTYLAVFGIGATLSAPYFRQAAANERHDMQDALGLARTDPPGKPTPPPAPYVIQIAAIVAAVNALDPADATLNLQLSQQAAAAAKAMLAAYPNAPQHTIDDMTLLSEYCNDLVFDFSQSPPLWSAALNTYVPGIESSVNGVELDFGLALTYDTNEVPAATSGSVNSPWGIVVTFVEQYAEGLAFGGVAGAIVNVSTNGGLLSGVEQGLSALGGAVESAVGDIGSGLQTLAAGIENFPRIIADSVGFVFNWTMGQLLGWIGPLCVYIGVGMAVVGAGMGFTYKNVWPRLERRMVLNVNARGARLWNRFDKWNKSRRKVQEVWTQKPTEGSIESANANPIWTPPVQELPEPAIVVPETDAPALQVKTGPEAPAPAPTPPEVGEDLGPGPAAPPAEPSTGSQQVETPPEEPAPAPTPPEPVATPPGEPTSTVTPPSLSETPVPPEGTTPAAEAYLGDHPSRAPTGAELVAAEENRRASMPPPMTHRQRKEERDRKKADRLIAMGQNWGEEPNIDQQGGA